MKHRTQFAVAVCHTNLTFFNEIDRRRVQVLPAFHPGTVRSTGFLVNDRITRFTPERIDIVHHDFDDQRNQFAKEGGAISHLVAVDRTVPSRTAVHELIPPATRTANLPPGKRPLKAAQAIVDAVLFSAHALGMTADVLNQIYSSFGEDPFIIGPGDRKFLA